MMHRVITLFLILSVSGCGIDGDSVSGLAGKVSQETFCEAFPLLWDSHIFPEIKGQLDKHLQGGVLTVKDYKKETKKFLSGTFIISVDPKKGPITISGLGAVKNDGVKILDPQLCLTPAEFEWFKKSQEHA